MKTLLVIILMFIVWFVSTQFGIAWPRISTNEGYLSIMPPAPSPAPEQPPEYWPEPREYDLSLGDIDAEIFKTINDIRIEKNREPLKESLHLMQKAKEHSLWMVEVGKYTHSTYNYCENIFWGVAISEHRLSDTIVNIWMASSPHRANLLEPGISKCGISVAYDSKTRSHYATFMAY